MNQMNLLPKEIENIIVNYKEEIEHREKVQPLLNEINIIKNKIKHYSENFIEVIITTKNKKHEFEVCKFCGDFIGSKNLYENNMCKCPEYD